MEYVDTLVLPLADLRPFPGNARIHDLDVIEESIRLNGQYRSLVVRVEDDGHTILAGNGTAEVLATRLGLTEARCELITCGDEEATRINLVDNKASDLARFDDEKLLANLRAVDDLRGTGFVPADTDALAERLRRHARSEAKAVEALAAARSDADVLVADDGTRTLVCRYHPDAYTWVAARLRECREEWSLATNGEALLRLLEEKFGASTLTARRVKSA